MGTVNLTDFDPNVDTFWLACMTGRWKASLKRGPAMVVFTNWPKGKLYKIEGGRFHLIADKNPDTHDGRCDICRREFHAAFDQYVAARPRRWTPGSVYRWTRDGSKIAEPLQLERVCVDCR